MDVELVERKGAGHPDTIADAVANEFSRRYVQYTLKHFGGTPRHSVDKLVLAGGTSRLAFGRGHGVTPIVCDVVGKITPSFGSAEIPVRDIAAESLDAVFARSFCSSALELLPPPVLRISANDGIGAEHHDRYYAPRAIDDLDTVDLRCEANDTAVVFGHHGPTQLEYLVWQAENHLTGPAMQVRFGTGTDAKVLASRVGNRVSVHVAMPFVASLVPSERVYRDSLAAIGAELHQLLQKTAPDLDIAAPVLNTKDRPGHGYLTLAGSSLDKGDQGAVGRGNNYSGVISMLRPQSMESHAGKNPFRSAGRIYPEICRAVSRDFALAHGVDITIGLQSANGRPLEEPSAVFGLLPDGSLVPQRELGVDTLNREQVVRARKTVLDPEQLHRDVHGRVADSVSR
ncbi:methionine adenosyltransferase [Streptomyces sp. NPDC059695]|uniref:methionine adenosyltransferase n=1 Tax=Streptomyces sp. NPDC059695 TaxID=3346910 RepID=UPI0036C23CCA